MIPVDMNAPVLQSSTNNHNHNKSQMEASMLSKKKQAGSHSVWYRTFLKPMIRKNRMMPYKESFQKRVVHSVGVPVGEIEGIHAMFNESHRHYSPLYGMIFTYNNYINNLYRYGDKENEPVVELIHELFHVLPGGEIQPTHAGRNAGAHLTTGIIGDIFEAFEQHKDQTNQRQGKERLANVLAALISEHPDYRDNTQKLNEDVVAAESELGVLEKKEADAEPVRQRIKVLEGDVIKVNRHQTKRLKKEQKKAEQERKAEIEVELSKLADTNKAAEAEVKELRAHIVTSLDFKVARKNLKRAQDAVDMERENRLALAGVIANSFFTHELDNNSASATSNLPHFSTTAVLLAYLWRKFDSIAAFEGYMAAMDRMGALNVPLSDAIELIELHANASSDESSHAGSVHSADSRDSSTKSRIIKRVRVPRRVWNATDIETAATITTGTPGNMSRPPVIQFSYVTWAAYSAFPDCGETALRNMFNQLVYNPDTGRFDHEVLQELKELYYPEMSDTLIEFYRKNDKPQDATNSDVAVQWIDVVSKLNSYRGWNKKDHDNLFIRYRREEDEQNIASPLRNAVRVVNALFGVTNVDGTQLVFDIVEHINDLRDMDVEVDLSGVQDDGFGILAISDGKVRYELQSYKPVHFGFVQAETMKSGSSRSDFRAFRRLMRHSNTPPRAASNTPQYFEQLALASLFVPYQLGRNTVGKFFRITPAHYPLLFADMDSAAHKNETLKWATAAPVAANDVQVQKLLHKIDIYVEPVFAPTKKSNQTKEDEHTR